jgi:hypothetical protein
MTDGIKIDWKEPGPDVLLSLVIMRDGLWVRDPTEDDITRALESLHPGVRQRVLGRWLNVTLEYSPSKAHQRIASLERELEAAKDLAGRMAVQAEEWREQAAAVGIREKVALKSASEWSGRAEHAAKERDEWRRSYELLNRDITAALDPSQRCERKRT